jgi:hypothetical protein
LLKFLDRQRRPSSRTSSFFNDVTIASSFSDGAFVMAVCDSGRLICTSGWSFLKVVETTKKISRIVRISTSETMISTAPGVYGLQSSWSGREA